MAPRGGGSDGKYFQTTKRGEIHELKEELHLADKSRKKDAVKKVIAAMTLGKDVSALFPDVVNCMQTNNIELKKLVYLYVIHYAKSQPDLAILAINTFRKDGGDPNPLLRALAVRTMGCIRIEQITEYLLEPLKRCCNDTDPYVRKTAAICIAKVYEIAPELVSDVGLLETLRNMVGDPNPMVVANAVASLTEISERCGKDWLKLTQYRKEKLLGALNECNEWGQVFLLDALSTADPPNWREAEKVIERVTARLSHANPAVVLSAVKVVLTNLAHLPDGDEKASAVCKKLTPPLVTLLSCEPEVVYVVLRNINLIVQRWPNLLDNDVKVFFCKYNDPNYVKLEKLDTVVALVHERNVEQVLTELKEYCTDVDVEFSRKAIKAISRVAVRLSRAVDRCLEAFGDLLNLKVNHIVQEVVVALKDIFRIYPGKHDLLELLTDVMDLLDEPEAKASMVWIIGEHAERMKKPDELLSVFVENFHDEPLPVQLQLVTAAVKLYLKQPAHQELVTAVLQKATEESEIPDLRDRGYVYWRMLSTNPDLTKEVVLGERAPLQDDTGAIGKDLLDRLLRNVSLMASVYHKAPEEFVTRLRAVEQQDSSSDDEDREERNERFREQIQNRPEDRPVDAKQPDLLGDLLDLDLDGDTAPSPPAELAGGSGGDLLGGDLLGGFGGAPAAPSAPPVPLLTVLRAQQPGSGGKAGVELNAAVRREGSTVTLNLSISNQSPIVLNQWAIQINKNTAGLAASGMQCMDCSPGSTVEASVPLHRSPDMCNGQPLASPNTLQVALKTSLDVFYFTVPVDLSVLVEAKAMDKAMFLQAWGGLEQTQSGVVRRSARKLAVGEVSQLIGASGVSSICSHSTEQADCAYFAGCFGRLGFCAEVAVQKTGPMVRLAVRSELPAFTPLFVAIADRVLGLTPQ